MSQESVEIARSRGQLPISDRQLRRLLRYPGALALIFRLVVLVPPRMWPRRNVAISEAMMLPPDTNAAALMRDDTLSSALVKAAAPSCTRPLRSAEPSFNPMRPTSDHRV